MAEGPECGLTVRGGDGDSAAELAAMRSDLARALNSMIDYYVEHYGKTPAEAAAQARQTSPLDPFARPPQQVLWVELSSLIARDPERGHALWDHLKAEAVKEYQTGMRTARAVEPPSPSGRPWDRARFAALVNPLRQSLNPRNAVEEILVQQMAAMHEAWLRWQTIATQRAAMDAWEGEHDRQRALARMSPAARERDEADHGWVPPRLGTAEAIEQAVMIADRYQRSFLRLLKAYRDNRRLFGALIVAGGQVNIGEQQVNVSQESPPRTAGVRPAAKRRTAPARMRRQRSGA